MAPVDAGTVDPSITTWGPDAYTNIQLRPAGRPPSLCLLTSITEGEGTIPPSGEWSLPGLLARVAEPIGPGAKLFADIHTAGTERIEAPLTAGP